MSFTSSTPSNILNSSTPATASCTPTSFSPFTISPSPSSPSSSSTNLKHHSRPSLAISYSHPPPPPSVHMTADPKLPTRAFYYSLDNRRPLASTKPSSSSTPSMSISTVVSSSTTAPPTATTSMQDVPTKKPTNISTKKFVAPAHPQSHHLHTLPPREKTTRTLILDHTAWRHGRTRFAQGRCELGMEVRIKGREGDLQDDESHSKRPAFYIGASSTNSHSGSQSSGNTSGSTAVSSHSSRQGGQQLRRRYSNFGELPEVDVISSDEEEERVSWDNFEGVSALAYGKRYRGRKQRRQDSLLGTNQSASSTAFLQVDADEDSVSDNGDSEDEFLTSTYQDARFAPLFAARADGIEKVLCSILQQINRPSPSLASRASTPPHSIYIPYTNTQYSFQSSPISETSRSRVLPNGFRLRLALLELINDLFRRQGSASYEQLGPNASGDATANEPDKSSHSNSSSSHGQNNPPAGLAALVQVSNQPFFAPPTLPSFRTLSLPSSSVNIRSPPLNGSSSFRPFGNSGPSSGPPSRPPALVFSWTRNSATPSPLNTLVRDKEHDINESATSPISPVDKAYRPSPVTLRAPAPDLPASWTDQVPKATITSSGKLISPATALIRRASGRAKDLYAAGCYSVPSSASSTQTFRRDIPTFSHRGTILTVPSPPPGYPIDKLKTLCPRHLREQCRICEPASTSSSPSKQIEPETGFSFSPATTRIGAGLLKKQRLLRERERDGGVDDQSKRTGSVLADMLPKFLRLSALIAIELGREARGEEPEARNGQEESDVRSEAVDSSTTATGTDNPTTKPSNAHAQPTRAWFALLSGLITRAVLEGYVTRGWKGADYIEILMGVGLGIRDVGTRRQSSGIGDFRDDNQLPVSNAPIVEDVRDEFDPDEMPGLVDACKILFSGLVRDAALSVPADSNETTTGTAEQEYVQEMEERMSEFLGISHSCPDLATHLTRMSEKYPAEPVERAALRFCEAIANWRGKPELEMYKKLSAQNSVSSTPALPIHALLASPAPQKPPIQRYFTVPFSARKPTRSSVRGLKRQRSVDEEVRGLKKEKVETRYMDVDTVDPKQPTLPPTDAIASARGIVVEDLPNADWVGPYGV